MCGERLHRMISACEKKLCAACYRAKLPYFQLVAVYRIMVKHIVLFKIPRVMDEIIVYGVFADLDIQACDDIAQINYLPVTRARINLIHFNSPCRESKNHRNDRTDTVICAAPNMTITIAAGKLCIHIAAQRKYSTGKTASGIGTKRNAFPRSAVSRPHAK